MGPRRRSPVIRAVRALLAPVAIIAATVVVLVSALGASPTTTSTTTTSVAPATSSTTTPTATAANWLTTWTSPMDYYFTERDLKPLPAVDATFRDLARVAVGGRAVKLQLSNTWSLSPTTFDAVTVGVEQSGAAVVPGSIVPVTFAGQPSVTIPAGARVMSDPIAMTVHAGETLAISLSVSGAATVSIHNCCVGHVDSYGTRNGAGNLTSDPAATPFVYGDFNMRWLSAIAVSGSSARGTVVAFGDSITEGFNNAGLSWPTLLQRRIGRLAPSEQLAVVDEGIAGNTVSVFPRGTTFAELDGGLPGVTRFGPDALALPGVRDVVVFLGTNDIWFGAGGSNLAHPIAPYGTAPRIEAALRALIDRAHAHGLKIFGVTLLPRATFVGGNGEEPEAWTPSDQATMDAVNAWILSPSSGFDGTIDLAAVMGDVYNGACRPTTPFAPYYTVDNLHPNTAGQTVMANAISTTLFGMPQAPTLPPLVAATPTPGCPAAVTAERVLAEGSAPATTTTTTTTTIPSRRAHPVHHRAGSNATARLLVAVALTILIGLIVIGLVARRRRALRRQRAREAVRAYRGPGRFPPSPRPPSPRPPSPRPPSSRR